VIKSMNPDIPPSVRNTRKNTLGRRTMDRSILITGCSSGIGYRTAHALAARGYRVIASARQAADVAHLQSEGLTAVRLDLDDPTSIGDAVGEVLERTGDRLYALFNNAGFGQPGAVEDLSREALRAQFETNLFGLVELTNHVLPIMRRQGQGRIVQTSSILGIGALPYRGAYVASKYALEGITDTLRLELKGSGVFVSLLEPGPIESRFRDNSLAAFERNIRREGSAHEQAYAALERRLQGRQGGSRFKQGPEAVVRQLIHALESPRPRARYPVTLPTRFFAIARRLLPDRALDWLLLTSSASERKR
jgi:NAD(P)-dependent dehydrogenase (short-subunit alcohol dehydrogenase family)